MSAPLQKGSLVVSDLTQKSLVAKPPPVFVGNPEYLLSAEAQSWTLHQTNHLFQHQQQHQQTSSTNSFIVFSAVMASFMGAAFALSVRRGCRWFAKGVPLPLVMLSFSAITSAHDVQAKDGKDRAIVPGTHQGCFCIMSSEGKHDGHSPMVATESLQWCTQGLYWSKASLL